MVKQGHFLPARMRARGPEIPPLRCFLLAKGPLCHVGRGRRQLKWEIIWGNGVKRSRPGSKLAAGQERGLGTM